VSALWQPGTLYAPGALVLPRGAGAITQSQPPNPYFADGLNDWTESSEGGSASWSIDTTFAFRPAESTQTAKWEGGAGSSLLNGIMGVMQASNVVPVRPGQRIRFHGYFAVRHRNHAAGQARIYWLDGDSNVISVAATTTQGLRSPDGWVGGLRNREWERADGDAVAPVGAVSAVLAVAAVANDHTSGGETAATWVGFVGWDYTAQAVSVPDGIFFRAVQAESAYSASTEPTWPTTLGQTVTDGGVIWEAIEATAITWTAQPILRSGGSEPDWPMEPGATIADGTIAWQVLARRITDERAPRSRVVAIASSKVYAADGDIIGFCATVNPLDWSELDDAGYLPFGLQSYGSEAVAALGLYRSNLVAFNAVGFQMWQVDEDPQNMALLDAVAVGSRYHRSLQPIGNDLVFLTESGVRSMGIAGASTNLQAGDYGKAIDPLVKAALAALEDGDDPLGLYVPDLGQYWLFFGAEAFVLTINGHGKGARSWSRYVFPAVIDDWTVLDGQLYLRAGDLIWRVDEDATHDDQDPDAADVTDGPTAGGANVPIEGAIEWHYLEAGRLGGDKQLIGFHLVTTGAVEVSVGYNQDDRTLATPPYALDGDTIPGDVIALPVTAPSFQLRLRYPGGEAWEWSAAALYVNDLRTGP
jgi:hypothetical protein